MVVSQKLITVNT
ncbi:hypothetical protein FWK35_00035220 [Aphis craccivora]|uniref:Uncharacterized protein n=1 Tax=Aphis craccivora TaxID=307492 RepID=A0A6G0Y8V7_APHCR|nr:hypothetical protein FWK35_00035220 [Aphis craccivora]